MTNDIMKFIPSSLSANQKESGQAGVYQLSSLFYIILPTDHSIEMRNETHELVTECYGFGTLDFQDKNRVWLVAHHPVHGVIGGLSLTASADHMQAYRDAYQISENQESVWIASHLFYMLDSTVRIRHYMYSQDRQQLEAQFYSELQQSLQHLAALFSIDHVILLLSLEQHQKAKASHQLSFKHDEFFNYDGDNFCAGHLDLNFNAQNLESEQQNTQESYRLNHPALIFLNRPLLHQMARNQSSASEAF